MATMHSGITVIPDVANAHFGGEEALVLVAEIEPREGWAAVMPISGPARMWPSTYEAKTGEALEPGRGYAIHIGGEER